ncbi:MAG: hypothetical protein OXC07_01570 [Kistimonas sp.]|nr:hypothetical protein [Kistimonas sp.]
MSADDLCRCPPLFEHRLPRGASLGAEFQCPRILVTSDLCQPCLATHLEAVPCCENITYSGNIGFQNVNTGFGRSGCGEFIIQ